MIASQMKKNRFGNNNKIFAHAGYYTIQTCEKQLVLLVDTHNYPHACELIKSHENVRMKFVNY